MFHSFGVEFFLCQKFIDSVQRDDKLQNEKWVQTIKKKHNKQNNIEEINKEYYKNIIMYENEKVMQGISSRNPTIFEHISFR